MSNKTPTNRTPMKTLLNICTDQIIKNLLEDYHDKLIENLPFLPVHVRHTILHRLNHFPMTQSRLIQLYTLLVSAQTLRIDLSNVYVDNDLILTLKQCTSLTELFITNATNNCLSTQVLMEVLPYFKHLVTLRITNCPAVTDDVILQLVTHSPDVAVLDVSGSMSITDAALIHMSHFRRLTALDLSKTDITIFGIEILVKSCGLKLRELQLASCMKLCDRTLQVICDNCPSIEILIYYDCMLSPENALYMNNLKNIKQFSWTVC